MPDLSPQDRAEIIKLNEEGHSRREIFERSNKSRSTVGRVLKEVGKGLPSNAERYRHIPTVEITKDSERGLSQRKIGKLRGMGACAVGNRLRKAGKVWQPPKLTPSQL